MYFFDTYAFFELLDGNPAYKKFESELIVTSLYNIGEFYHGLLQQFDTNIADKTIDRFQCQLIEIDLDGMKDAMHMRRTHRRKKMSVIDCCGYILAQRHNMKFLTGDKQFKDMPGVEFVQ